LPAALQRADQLRPRPLQDPDHTAGGLIPLIPPRDTWENIAPHQHMVAVHRGRGRILCNADGRDLRIVRLQETHPSPVHTDAARHEIGGEGQSVTVALLDARDLAVPLQPRQYVLKFALLPLT
jgi:hypothetical protein